MDSTLSRWKTLLRASALMAKQMAAGLMDL